MPTPVTNSMSSPTNAGKNGLPAGRRIELDPWDIADLLICKRGEQFVSVELATDAEFASWVRTNSIAVRENGIDYWTFDDRCRLINHVLGYGGTLEFADGSRIPEEKNNSENSINSVETNEFNPPDGAA